MKSLKILTLLTAILLPSFANAQNLFTDTSEETFYSDSIQWMSDNQIIQGYPDGTFKPDKCVNRAEMLKMTFLTSQRELETQPEFVEDFSDVDYEQWYGSYLHTAVKNGVVEGYPDGTFKPANCVNRVEAIKIVLEEFNIEQGPSAIYANPFDIANMGNQKNWWSDYYTTAMGANLVGTDHFERFDADWSDLGVDSDFANPTYNFQPDQPMSRKEVAELLFRTKIMVDSGMDYFSKTGQ
jgi:hypothetical protein